MQWRVNNLQPPPSTGLRDPSARPQALSAPLHLRLNGLESAQSRPQVAAQSWRHRSAPVVSTHLRLARSSWSGSPVGRRPRVTQGTSDLSPDVQALTFCAFHRNAGQASIAARTDSGTPIETHRSRPDQSVANRLQITPPNAFSRTNRHTEKTVSAMHTI